MHAQWSGLCHNPYGNWLGGPSDVHSIVAAIPTLNLADARASREPDEVVDNAVFLEPIEEEPPERGSAAEAELIARFWHDYSSRMPQDSHAVGEQWAAACLRYRGYHVRDAAHSLRNYLDWRRVFELDRLAGYYNEKKVANFHVPPVKEFLLFFFGHLLYSFPVCHVYDVTFPSNLSDTAHKDSATTRSLACCGSALSSII